MYFRRSRREWTYLEVNWGGPKSSSGLRPYVSERNHLVCSQANFFILQSARFRFSVVLTHWMHFVKSLVIMQIIFQIFCLPKPIPFSEWSHNRCVQFHARSMQIFNIQSPARWVYLFTGWLRQHIHWCSLNPRQQKHHLYDSCLFLIAFWFQKASKIGDLIFIWGFQPPTLLHQLPLRFHPVGLERLLLVPPAW